MITEAEVQEMALDELLEVYSQQKRLYRLEGSSGVRNLSKIIQSIGYPQDRLTNRHNPGDVIQVFLEDNPGAMEAIYNWIGETNLTEWKDSIRLEIKTEENTATENDAGNDE